MRQSAAKVPSSLSSLLSLAGLCALVAGVPGGAWAASRRLDPAMIVGPEACSSCHEREYELWRRTKHARIFTSGQPLDRQPRALEISRKLGIATIQRDNLCLNCHFTPKLSSGQVTAAAGVSCESCHGAARGWIAVHNRFEDRPVRRADLSAANLRRVRERNAQAGMRSGGGIYDLVSRCYGCHMVPEERLVDAGGHSNGGGFDLVARFDAIRHNFISGGRAANAPLTAARRRQLYVLGLVLELESSLRGIAEAKENGVYAESLARGVERLRKKIRKVQRLAALPQLEAAFTAADGLRLEAGNGAEVGYAVEKVAAAGASFAAQEDGGRLAALDPLLRPEPEEAPAPPVDEAAAEAPEAESARTEETARTAGPAEPGKPAQGPGGTRQAAPRQAAPATPATAAGPIRTHLRGPLTPAKVIGADGCSASCHKLAVSWWSRDAHYRAADPFLNRAARNRQIATFYYGRPADDLMATGKAVCMDCHGTVLTGKAAEEVEQGVGCESCHGPAGSFRETHKDRKSHAERIALGITDLENLDRRAEVCAGCHYITDPRLLASGHSSGRTFDPVARNRTIEHWSGGQPPPAALQAAWRKVLAARGAVPQVQVAKLSEEPVSAPGPAGPGRAGGPGGPVRLPAAFAAVRRGGPPAPPPAAPRSSGAGTSGAPRPSGRPIHLAPWPEGVEKRPVAEALHLIQQRLEALYAASGG